VGAGEKNPATTAGLFYPAPDLRCTAGREDTVRCAPQGMARPVT